MNFSDCHLSGPYHPSPLFGPLEKELSNRTIFLPLWNAVETPLLPMLSSHQEYFLPGALKSLREEFLSFCNFIWGPILEEELLKMVGPLHGSWVNWFRERVLPILEDNSLYLELEKDYPVFAREAKVYVTQARSFVEELLKTLGGHYEEIRVFFSLGTLKEIVPIRGVFTTGSDRSNGGKIIQRIEYENGLSLIWRPRDLKIERAFHIWLDYLCDKAGLPHFRHCRSLDILGGSLCEFIHDQPLSSLEEAPIFFRNGGFLLGAVYMLGGSDCHASNIIACGRWPVLIDTETVLYTSNRFEREGREERYSLDRVNFLPFCRSGPGIYPGQDNLTRSANSCKNLPVFNGEYLTAYEYPTETVEGFSMAMEVWRRDFLEAAAKAEQIFDGVSFRIVLRSTRFYWTVQRCLNKPACLSDPVRYEQAFEVLAHNIPESIKDEAREKFLKMERDALEQLDFPLFYENIGPWNLTALKQRILSISQESLEKDVAKADFLLRPRRIWESCPLVIPCSSRSSVSTCRLGSDADFVTSPASQSRTKSGFSHLTRPSKRDLAPLAEHLCLSLEERYGSFTLRNTGKSYLLSSFLSMPEGAMGALIGLLSYARLWPDSRVSEAIKGTLSTIEDNPYLLCASLSPHEPGLCEGMGGLLLSLGFLGKCGSSPGTTIMDFSLERISLPLARLEDNPCLGYGRAGLLLGLQWLPEKIQEERPLLVSLERELRTCLKLTLETETLPTDEGKEGKSMESRGKARGDSLLYGREGILLALGEKKWTDLYEGDSPFFSDNQTLVYGMAGALYAETLKRKAQGGATPSGLEDSYAKALLMANYPCPPKGVYAPGLCYGEAGRLYALCKYLDPENIPDLF